MNIDAGRAVLSLALGRRVCPAAVVEAGGTEGPVWREAFGRLSYDADAPLTTTDTLFDLASLTKVIATATVAMRLVDRGALDIEDPVRTWVPDWAGAERAPVTVRDLLEHCSGLPAWQALYRTCRGVEEYTGEICRLELAYRPRQTSVYSDLGFILLGRVLERAGGASLDTLFGDALCAAFGDEHSLPLMFRPGPDWRQRSAPTQVDEWRGRLLRGEVDDQNAWAIGGVAAHAGLFGTAGAVGTFARAVLTTIVAPDGRSPQLADASTLRRFMELSAVAGSSRALAWDRMRPTSSCGAAMSPEAIGHTGFTGTSLWIDPARAAYVVLLTNRVHPKASDPDAIQQVRRALHDALLS